MPELRPEQADRLQRKVKEYLKIAEKVRTGEYFREAMNMYNIAINDPLSERYFYIIITLCSLTILGIAYMAVQGLYPLNTAIPLTFLTHDIIDEQPHLRPLRQSKQDSSSELVLRYLVKNYVYMREEYSIEMFDRNVNGIKSQTAPELFKKFQEYIDPHNPESPIAMYQRHSVRTIRILLTRRYPDSMDVTFEATVDGKNDVKKSQWRANIAFSYSGIERDEKTGKLMPVRFLVTDYTNKRLQDVK